MIKKVAGKKVEGLTCQYLWNCCLLQAKRRNLPQKSKLLASGVKLSRASNRIPRYGQVVITFCLWWLSGVSIVEYVKHCPLNNYFILDLTVMQCSVNKIFRCIYSDYLLAASVYSVVLNTRSLCLVNYSLKTPGARPVTGTRDKPLRHVHKTVNIICEGLLLLVFSSLQSNRWRGRQSADGRRGTW